MLVDTHVHLNSEKFDNNLKEVIERALNNDVKTMIVVGFDKKTNARAISLAEEYPFIYATVGFHPTDAKDIKDSDYDLLIEQLKHKKVVGVGECGMDFYWDKEHADKQTEVFKRQIDLSFKYNKPLIIHMRDASEATYNILSEYKNLKGVMHCYSGSPEMANDFLNLGLYISLGGPVTFKNGHKPKKVAEMVPLDKILVETDSPYLSPHPFRGKINEPFRVKLVAEEIARIKNMSYEDFANQTTKNAYKLFNIKEKI
ncbi:MAG: TatD family hydrolase [Candidatus Izimaplasma sp.]|nr:TatD family hydrolase [Candidatus Izimaplasma bacterium]